MSSETKNLNEALSQFTGTTQYYKGWVGVKWTEGVHFFAKNIAQWLITDISSYKIKYGSKRFLVFQLVRNEGDEGAVLKITDGNKNVLGTQTYKFVDLPNGLSDENLKFYYKSGVLMLPSEY